MAGNTYGRVIGIIAGSLGALGALLSIGGAYPWWNLAVFAVCVYVVYGLIVYGEDERRRGRQQPERGDRRRPRSRSFRRPWPPGACAVRGLA